MVARLHHRQSEKRHGHHQSRTKHFLNVYHPYLPLLLIFTLIIVFFSLARSPGSSVLSYATDASSSGLLTQTNAERTRYKQTSLKLDAKLTRAAQNKADDMAQRNYWSHITPSGQPPWHFIEKADYSYVKVGENLAYGFNSSRDIVYAWMNSKPHKENVLDRAYHDVGFGIANAKNYINNGPETIVVAMYGQKSSTAVLGKNTNGQAVNSANALTTEPNSINVAKVALFARGSAPWVTSAIGVIIGICLAVLFIKHGLALRRVIKKGERFAIRHPLLDVVIIILVCVGIILTRSAGLIR